MWSWVSKLMAEFFTLRLASIGIGAIIVDTELNDSLHAALAMIDDKTLLIPISLPDYYFMTDKVAAYAKGCKAKILVLTDNDQYEFDNFLIGYYMLRYDEIIFKYPVRSYSIN